MVKTLTYQMVRKRVAAIEKADIGDGEAHETEDDLYADVLAAIAGGYAVTPAACAREALKTREINFSRWYS